MAIQKTEISIRDLTEGYRNDNIEGVTGYNGNLDIRPRYQREYIYNDKQRDAVINTVRKGRPLNNMHWGDNDNGKYEVLDGQQRSISICEYVAGTFSINSLYFHNLESVEQEQILNYKLDVHIFKGDSKEKLEWFTTINIAGVELSNQELRNAVYSGEWLTHAKQHFSKTGGVAYNVGKDFLKGVAIRQAYLETTLKWISNNNINDYMSVHQHDQNANELWLYFQNVIHWVNATFPNYRREMKGVEWGYLYNTFNTRMLNTDNLEREVSILMQDEDVTKKSGIYTYVLTKEEKHLSIRAFTDNNKREAYERQDGNCTACDTHFEIDDMEADHITPWSKSGKTISDNCQMLCMPCNRIKSNK